MNEVPISKVDLSNPDWVIRDLETLGPGVIVTDKALARIFNRSTASIKRAVERGELPPSTKLLGSQRWTVGAILVHIEERLAHEQTELEEFKKSMERHHV